MAKVLLVCVLLVSLSAPAHAQVLGTGVMPVMEVGANLWQSTITATESVLHTVAMTQELLPLEEILAAQGIADDLAALADVLADANALAYDLQSLERQIVALFDLETAPATRSALDARLVEIKRTVYEARTFAMRVQTLITTIHCTVDHLFGLLNSVGVLVGNMQANQRLIEAQATISKTLTVQTAMNTSWQRADIVERLSGDLVRASMAKIADQRLADWPRF